MGMSGGKGGGSSGGMGGPDPMDEAAMDVFERIDKADNGIPDPAEMPSVDVPETEDMFGDLLGPDRGTDEDDDMRIY